MDLTCLCNMVRINLYGDYASDVMPASFLFKNVIFTVGGDSAQLEDGPIHRKTFDKAKIFLKWVY